MNNLTITPPLELTSALLGNVTSSTFLNGTLFNKITLLLNGTALYSHQVADLIEPEKNPALRAHMINWTFSIITYILAIPIALRIVQLKTYLNVIDYFSFHIILCSFLAWVPSVILLLYHWFQLLTLRLCRWHYVILSTNETVPILLILYMVVDRFLYAYPSLKQKCVQLSHKYCIYLYPILTWLVVIMIYIVAAPFTKPNSNTTIAIYTAKYCPYDYRKLQAIAAGRSIIYFCIFVPALILIGFVLHYFYLLRGTNQIPIGEKLWTIRVTLLLSLTVFYDIYLYYLVHVSETYKSFLVASVLRSSVYLAQLVVIACTDSYWLQVLCERCACLSFIFKRSRRTPTVPVALPTETDTNNPQFSASAGHYSLVDNIVRDEFDQVVNSTRPV